MGSYDFDDYKKDHVDGKIKDNNGDARHGGGNNKPDADLSGLTQYGAKVEAVNVYPENYDGMDYETIYAKMEHVSENIAPGYKDTLTQIAQNINGAIENLKDRLGTLESEGGWKGKTHNAAMANLLKSYDIPAEAAKAAGALGVLSEYYSQTMSTNKHNIRDQWTTYQDCLTRFPSQRDEVKQYFNDFARNVMKNFYWPEIADIAKNQPAVTSTATPEVAAPPPGSPPPGSPPPGSPPPGSPPPGSPPPGSPPPGSPPPSSVPPGGGPSGSPNGGGGGNPNGAPNGSPPFSPPNLPASSPGGSPGGGSPGGSKSGSGSPGGGGAEAPKSPPFSPPDLSQIKAPELGAGSGSPNGSGKPGGSNLPGNGDTPKFDPSTILTSPKSVAAANKLLADPKTADAAKKLLSDPKLTDAAKTLFGDGKQDLLGNPKALEAAKTLFGDPQAADAAKALFGNPETAKAAQQLLNDPHLGDLSKALEKSGILPTPATPDLSSADGLKELSRNLAGQSGLGSSNLAGLPAAAMSGGSSDPGSSLLGGVMDGINQIVQTAQQGAAPQPPELGGPGLGDHPGGASSPAGGAGHAGGGGGGAAPGKVHLSTAGAPIAAASNTLATHAGALTPATDGSPAGASGGGGAPPGGGHGGGGRGGEGKDHKGSKALRGRGNGEDILGEPEAVVAVIGDDKADDGSWSADQ